MTLYSLKKLTLLVKTKLNVKTNLKRSSFSRMEKLILAGSQQAILEKDLLNFKKNDENGRFLILEAMTDDCVFILIKQ